MTRTAKATQSKASQFNENGVKHLLKLHHLVAVRQLVLLLPPADPLRIGQFLRQDLDVVVGAVRVGRVRVPVLEDGVLPQTNLQLPQEDPDDPFVLDGLRRSYVVGKQGIARGKICKAERVNREPKATKYAW